MSSLRNALPRRAHKERSQPHSRRKFGLLEKHKDYVVRAKNFHQKEQTLQKLKEKAAFRNPDEFNFKMIKSRTVNGVHKPIEVNKFAAEDLTVLKKQDIGYTIMKLQSEKKKIEKLHSVLHSTENLPSNKHVYYAVDREEAKETLAKITAQEHIPVVEDLPEDIKRKTVLSYRELEARRERVKQLEKTHAYMALKRERKKKEKKRKLREDEIVCPTSGPVYKWRKERKR